MISFKSIAAMEWFLMSPWNDSLPLDEPGDLNVLRLGATGRGVGEFVSPVPTTIEGGRGTPARA